MSNVHFFILVLALSVSSKADSSQSKRLGQVKRFFLTDVVNHFVDPKYKREECILCKCFQECHSEQFHISETDLCKPYVDHIKCKDVNRCTCCKDLVLFNACENGGKCHDRGHGNFTCDCPTGYNGQRCESSGALQPQQTDHCAGNPCYNEGACSNSDNGFVCQCTNGWTGDICDIDIDECATSSPCKNGGGCTNTQGKYTCTCTGGWTGTNCDTASTSTNTKTDYCNTNPCKNGAVCVNGANSYTCRCQADWTGTNCETRMDSCQTNLTCLHGTCVESNGVFSCSCDQGWKGNTCQTDVNECDADTCKNGAACTNSIGQYTCSCRNGWSGTQCDKDVDECMSQPCQNGSTCHNNAGSYSCSCASGFTGTTCGTDVDECTLYRFCQNGATCTNIPGSFTCTCASGWTGKQCNSAITVVDGCASNPCMHGSTCSNTMGSYVCNCSAGWSGDQCQIPAQPVECDHICTLQSVVRLTSVNDANAEVCAGSGNHSSNEAIPMTCCYLQKSASWIQGQQVTDLCNNGTPKPYIPVAAYRNGVLEPDTAGVFTGCLSQGEPGFLIIRQSCVLLPHLYHVNGTRIGTVDNNPDNYFVLL